MQYHEQYSARSGFAFAPEKFLGDWSQISEVGAIVLDHKTDAGSSAGLWGSGAPRGMRLAGPGGTAYWEGSVPEFSTEWTTVTARLEEVDWIVTAGTWDDLPRDADSFQIRVNAINFSHTGSYDLDLACTAPQN